MNDAAPFAGVSTVWYEGATLSAGVFDGMPSEIYHKHEAMSAHGSKVILRTPQHFRVMRDTMNNDTTPAKQFGTVVHDGTLEPNAFDARVVREPGDAPKRPTKAQRAAKKPSHDALHAIGYWDEFDRVNAGRIMLSPDDFDRARRVVDAVRAHPAAAWLLDGAIVERSLFWQDKMFDVPCKARLDIYNRGGVTDLKTCDDASPDGFSRAIGSYDYSLQGWSNFSGCEHVLNRTPEFFAFICVETEPPHCVAVYELGRESLMLGARQWDEALSRYKRAIDAGKWEGYPTTIEKINAPRWKLRNDV